jgi:hypothetical protein
LSAFRISAPIPNCWNVFVNFHFHFIFCVTKAMGDIWGEYHHIYMHAKSATILL